MHARRRVQRQRPVRHEPRDGVLVVEDVVVLVGGGVHGGDAGAGFVDLVVLAAVRVGADAGEEGVSVGFGRLVCVDMVCGKMGGLGGKGV